MQIIKINPCRPSRKAIKSASRIIKKGGVAIYPTDTIYGLGANALDRKAVGKIYKIKKRPENKPFSVVVADIEMAKKYCDIRKSQEEIFRALLPGPFTLILRKKKKAKIFTAYKNTVSVRIPNFPITKLLIEKAGIPLTSTSANISGLPGSGDIKKIIKQLANKKDQIDLVLDAGILPKRKPSTIIDLTGKEPKIIRK